MKKTVPDIKWLPPREEWDFRSVTPAECRVACHWEYSRETHCAWQATGRGISSKAAEIAKETRGEPVISNCPQEYHQQARELFPRAWVSLTTEQRISIMESFYSVPKLQVRTLREFLERIQWAKGDSENLIKPFLDHCHVITPNFSLYGVEAVIKEFEVWARKAAKNYRQSPRAKGAEPPFDALKWLAVKRLEKERRKVRINFETTQETICEYRRKHPQRDANDVFPIYTSHGAWSKAATDAARYGIKVSSRSSGVLAGLT